jgi:hypothetical protein
MFKKEWSMGDGEKESLTDGIATPAEVGVDDRFRRQKSPPSLSALDIHVSRSGGNKFVISGPDAEALHHILSQSYAEPGGLRGQQFVLSQQAQHEFNPPVKEVIDELNKRADSRKRDIQ